MRIFASSCVHTVSVLAIAAGARTGAAQTSTPESADAVVTHVRAALGIERLAKVPAGVRLAGDCRFLGIDCDFELITDAKAHFMERIAAREAATQGFGVTYGSDGSTVWTSDLGRERAVIECGDREAAVLGAGIITGRWFAADAPMIFSLAAPPPATAESVTLDFKLKDGVAKGTVDIDSHTWLPRRWSYGDGVARQTVDLSGTVKAGPVTFPATVEQSSSNGLSIIVTITTAAEAPSFVRSPYEFVSSAPTDVKFDAAISSKLEVKKAPTGHLLVHPLVNGKDVGWFIFDTGAGSNCLDSRAAEELGVEKFGSIPAAGVGGAVSASLCTPDTLTIGPVTLEKSMLTILDFAFLDQYMGTKVGGIVGYGLLHRCIAEFDGSKGEISLHDPAKFDDAAVRWQKLTLYNRHPCVEASFEDHTGLFKLDTGAQGTVTMHYPAVASLKLLEGRSTTDAQQGGVGGRVAAKAGTLAWFELGGVRTENVKAIFAGENKGAFADEHTVGNIGGTLLQPFKLVFDYQHSRIAFVKR